MKRLSDYVGNTPLIPIKLEDKTIWGKAELMNPGGSVKDRMATFILNDAEMRGLIKKGDYLCEATSGNTGISFAMLAIKFPWSDTRLMLPLPLLKRIPAPEERSLVPVPM